MAMAFGYYNYYLQVSAQLQGMYLWNIRNVLCTVLDCSVYTLHSHHYYTNDIS